MDQAASGRPTAAAATADAAARWAPTWRLHRQYLDLPTGVRLAYADLPPGAVGAAGPEPAEADGTADRDGPTIVLLHGLTNDADSWADTAAELQALAPAVRLVIPDLRGHGASGLPADGSWRTDPVAALSMAEFAADVVALLDVLDIDAAMLVGHSMGSLVATTCALAHPDRVTNLVLASTTADARATPFLSDWLWVDVIENTWRRVLESRGVRWPEQAMALRPIDVDPDAVTWMQTYWNLYPFTPGRSTRELAQRSAHLPLATWVGATRAVLDADNREFLRTITTEVCALWATQDSFFRTADQQVMIDALHAAAQQSDTGFVWKQYGRRPLAADGLQTDDLGHNLTWDAPGQVAIDIAAIWRTGEPTGTWFHSDAPSRPHEIVAVPDAPVVRSGADSGTAPRRV